jgi:hypothetical protein
MGQFRRKSIPDPRYQFELENSRDQTSNATQRTCRRLLNSHFPFTRHALPSLQETIAGLQDNL